MQIGAEVIHWHRGHSVPMAELQALQSSPHSSGAADVLHALQFPFFSPIGVRNRSVESTAKQIPLVLSLWN